MTQQDNERGGAFWMAYQDFKRSINPGCSDHEAETYARRAWRRYVRCERINAEGLGRLLRDVAGPVSVARAG